MLLEDCSVRTSLLLLCGVWLNGFAVSLVLFGRVPACFRRRR